MNPLIFLRRGNHFTIFVSASIAMSQCTRIASRLHAALVDGANAWQQFWRVTLPLLGHTLALIMVLLAIGSLQEFTIPNIMTQGGPGSATYTYNLLLYEEAFMDMRFGTATAAALFQFVFILFISVFQLKLIRPSWSY